MAHVAEVVNSPYPAFHDRDEAGGRLAEFLLEQGARVDLVLAVPSGGVAVVRPLAERLGVPFDIVLVRKLPLPMEPEAGFGAVTLDGQVVLNEGAVAAWGLSDAVVQQVLEDVLEELRQRERTFREGRRRPEVAGRDVLLVDDGLASGATMKAAVKAVSRQGPGTLSVAVPDAPTSTVEEIESLVDDLYCLVAQRPGAFAVASFYRHWHDLTDAEVLEILRGGRREQEPNERRP